MPPFLPRKRSPPPRPSARPVPTKRARLTDALDAEATNSVPTLKQNRTFSLGSDDSSSETSLSDIDSDQFEDVTISHKEGKIAEKKEDDSGGDEGDDEDGDVVWEDAATLAHAQIAPTHVPMANGPIQITLRKDDEEVIDYGTAAKAGRGKTGPTKREKQARATTHQLHVQFLLWHNAIRNSWIGDKHVQDILVKQLPSQIVREVEKWKRASGLTLPDTRKKTSSKSRKNRKTREEVERSQRDWGRPSQKLEAGKADMSHGDPLITLMKVLAAYWKKRFAITAPGLRKRGYGTKHGLKQDITSLRNDEHDPERHGERIRNLTEFRSIAQKGEGSRDVGAQLFTALIKGLGIEARLVASLQPSGYGWTKVEQMIPRKPARLEVEDDTSDDMVMRNGTGFSTRKHTSAKPLRKGGSKSMVISLDTDEDDDSNDIKHDDSVKDDDSVVDMTPAVPKQRRARYDRDLAFPIYWTEVISPVTNKVLPVSPLVLETPVASTPEALALFEPKGAKAEKGRQVMAYVIAYASDGTAKDVTVRYLRKQVWPGKTKGFRLPIEKVPIYDMRGKVKRYEDYDWFKTVLSPYCRSDTKRTAVDDVEDSTDLAPQRSERKNDEDGVDTLQSLKASADFVLERFLRREEALKPGSEPARIFVSGKGDKYKEEAVYRRADVERCLTAESWHKEGRAPKLGETPMKMVPVRAVTLTRKREAEEHERLYGEKQTQGLYSWDQTEYIIPPPIKDGIIPKNAYGNMDCFVPSMVPKGAVHIPLRGTLRICKKLEIDFAEAVTGFEFGNKRAVPVCTGVVVAKENEKLVKDAWQEWNEQQKIKEDAKLEKLVLDLWRKFVLGLRIRERVQDMYGEDIGIIQDEPTGLTKENAIAVDEEEAEEQTGGGFMKEDEDEEMGGGFLLPHEEDAGPMEDLIMDEQQYASQSVKEPDEQYPTPASISPIKKGKGRVVDFMTSNNNSDLSDVVSTEGDSESDEHEGRIEDASTKFKRDNPNQPTQLQIKVGNTTIRRPTTDGSDSTDNESELEVEVNEFHDTDGDDEEIYTPRPTRTRIAKPGPSAKPTTNSRLRGESHAGSKLTSTSKSKPETKTNARLNVSCSDEEEDSPVPSNATRRRGRGRPPKSVAKSRTEINPPRRSIRSLRRDSTVVTSPYFEQ